MGKMLNINPEAQESGIHLLSHWWHGDCREFLSSLHNTQFDLVFADPPFNNGSAYDVWNDELPYDEYVQFTREWISSCNDRLSDTGSMFINVPDSLAAMVAMTANDLGMPLINWCIWHYRFGQHTKHRFIPSKTHCLWFANSRTGKYYWYPESVEVESDRSSIYNDERSPTGYRPPFDVWGFEQYWGRVQGNNAERSPLHVNQLPEKYLERVILATTKEGDKVFDPFCGTGTTAVVASALKRRCWTCDVSLDYLKSAIARTKKGAVRV